MRQRFKTGSVEFPRPYKTTREKLMANPRNSGHWVEREVAREKRELLIGDLQDQKESLARRLGESQSKDRIEGLRIQIRKIESKIGDIRAAA